MAALTFVRRIQALVVELILLPVLALIALSGRFRSKAIDVGLGPEPLINNVHHKRALEQAGYRAETFVNDVYFITDDFDIRADLKFHGLLHYLIPRRMLVATYLFHRITHRYRMVYIYFNGGPLNFAGRIVRVWEPWLLKLSGVKVVVMPYGGDVQDMSQTPNLRFKHAVAADYPQHHRRKRLTARQVDRWTRHSDHVISGCDWVDYMYHWDTLMLGHFSLEVAAWTATPATTKGSGPLRVLHAPNHRTIKGSDAFERAVQELVDEGVAIELVLLQRVPNSRIREVMADVDVVADQLVIGWYAMFAIEAMAMGKAVLCYLRDDLVELYESAGLVRAEDIPLVRCSPGTVKDVLRRLAQNRALVHEAAERGPAFVRRHHSTEVVGAEFARINTSLGVRPEERA